MGSWRLGGLSSREIEGYSELCHSFSACSYLLLVAAEDVNTDLLFSFHFTEGTSRTGWLFPLLNAWIVCNELNLLSGERQKGFDWQPGFTSQRSPSEHRFSSCLWTSPESVSVDFTHPTQTLGSTVFTWTGHTRITLIKPGKTLPQWHVGLYAPRPALTKTHTHTPVCSL